LSKKHAGTTALKTAPWTATALKAFMDEAVGMSTIGQIVRGQAPKKNTIESLREACGRLVEAVGPDAEAADATKKGRVFKVLLITEGLSENGENYYGPEAIGSCPEAFEGSAAYIDHPTKSEADDQPERTVRKLCGYYRNVEAVQLPTGVHASPAQLVTDDTEAGRYAAEVMEAALNYEKDFPGQPIPHCGLSINAGGVGEERMMNLAEGQKAINYVLQIVKKPDNSVDIVTIPARGGRVLECLESLRRKEDVTMKKLIESLTAAYKAAKESKDPKVTTAKLAEAEVILAKLAEAEMPGAEEAFAKKDGESDEAHQARCEAAHASLSKMLGKTEGSTLGNDDPAAAAAAASPDTVHATGKAAHALLKGKESAEAREARRLAVKQLITESKIPEKYAKALNVEALSSVSLSEAKAQIASFKALSEAMRADTEEQVAAGGEKLIEASGGKRVGINLSECVRS
jgi:hypothetical protein